MKTNKKNVTRSGNRELCLGGCGTMVLIGKGECRDCRRKRLRKGAKIVLNATPRVKVTPKYETAKQKFDRVRNPKPLNIRALLKNRLPFAKVAKPKESDVVADADAPEKEARG